eukprot:gene9161-12378_t
MESLIENTPRIYTIEEYLSMEEKSIEKHHFINGEIIPMPGGSYYHNLIIANIIAALHAAIESKSNFNVLNGDMKIFIPRVVSFLYPNAVVICEEP